MLKLLLPFPLLQITTTLHTCTHKALLLRIHGQYNQEIFKDQLEENLPDHLHQLTFTIFLP